MRWPVGHSDNHVIGNITKNTAKIMWNNSKFNHLIFSKKARRQTDWVLTYTYPNKKCFIWSGMWNWRGHVSICITYQASNDATIVGKHRCWLFVDHSWTLMQAFQFHNPDNSKFVSKTNILTIIAYCNCSHSFFRWSVTV